MNENQLFLCEALVCLPSNPPPFQDNGCLLQILQLIAKSLDSEPLALLVPDKRFVGAAVSMSRAPPPSPLLELSLSTLHSPVRHPRHQYRQRHRHRSQRLHLNPPPTPPPPLMQKRMMSASEHPQSLAAFDPSSLRVVRVRNNSSPLPLRLAPLHPPSSVARALIYRGQSARLRRRPPPLRLPYL